LVPGYNAKGALTQLYHYTNGEVRNGKPTMYLRPTAGLDLALFGVPLWKKDKPKVAICEGVFDGMALWETLQYAKETPEIVKSGVNGSTKLETLITKCHAKISYTGNTGQSLYATTYNVVAVPGANVWKDAWTDLFTDKDVLLPFDSDHPTKHAKTGASIAGAGIAGAKRVSEKLISANGSAPKSIAYLKWGDKGYDEKLPTGYDVRDAIAPAGAKDIETRVGLLSSLFQRVQPIPHEWVPARTAKAKAEGGTDVKLIPCNNYKALRNVCRAAMSWIDGLDATMICCLASILSTETIGDQVWLNVLSPPSTGKSELCEALTTSRDYTHAESVIRGFISGFIEDGDKKKDCGLIPKIKGKTLITKEGDAFMNAPDLSRILGEARDLYDGALRASWRNGKSHRYENTRFTWILCGTPGKMSKLDQSELGARFLRVTIMTHIDEDLEDEIGMRAAYQARDNTKRSATDKKTSGVDPAVMTMRRMTGGYINHLRKNATEILNSVSMNDDALRHCNRLGRFVACMRARQSEVQDETVTREFSARLIKQLVRLAMCAAGVMNKTTVDHDVLKIVSKVAIDTAAGRTLNLVKLIHPTGMKGATTDALAMGFDTRAAKLKKDLEFLADPNIRVCECHHVLTRGGIVPQIRWRLTPNFYKLYSAVVVDSVDSVSE